MNYLRRFYLEREIKRLEERISASPQPNDFIKIIPLYIELGEIPKAEEMKRKAQQLYPTLDLSRIPLDKPEKAPDFDFSKEIEDVRMELAANPSPWLYGRLARLYLNSGAVEKAEETAKDALNLFPSHPYPYVLLAEIAVMRNDRQSAAKFFDLAVRYDSSSAVSIVHLAEYYQEVRDFDRTRKLLEMLLLPHRSVSVSEPPKTPPTPQDITSPTARDTAPAPPAAEPKKLRESGRLESALDHALGESGPEDPRYVAYVTSLKTLSFLQGVVIIDKEGKVLASDLPYALSEDDVKSALNNLWLTSMTQAKQMMLGSYRYSAFEGESGGFFIFQAPECVVGLLFDKRRRLDREQQEIFEFCRQLFS